MEFLILALACLGAHRIWNYEEIFASVRNWMRPWNFKPLTCPVCNAFWIALCLATLQVLVNHPAVHCFMLSLAVYPIVRSSVWLYARLPSWVTAITHPLPHDPFAAAPAPELIPTEETHKSPSVAPPPYTRSTRSVTSTPELSPALMPTSSTGGRKKLGDTLKPPMPAPPVVPGCGSCAEKKAKAVQNQVEAQKYEKRVVILTSLSYFPPAYSVSTVILDQARMLARAQPNWLIQVWVQENCSGIEEIPLPNLVIRPLVPVVVWKEDTINVPAVERLANTVLTHLMVLGNATIITHDLLFISQYLTFAAAIHRIGQTRGFSWLHVCHSAASIRPSGEARKWRGTLPDGHKLLCLNQDDAHHLANHYGTDFVRVEAVPNARDLTTFGEMHPRAVKIINDFGLANAGVVQIYPVSGTRMGAKGVSILISLFAVMARYTSVKLVLVNAHSGGKAVREAIAGYREQATKLGLAPSDFILTSEVFPDSANEGLPARAVRDLMSASNLFVMPSVSEASSLVFLEAALSGCLLVGNSSLHTMRTLISAENCLSFPFGSVRDPGDKSDHVMVAQFILQALDTTLNRSKREALRTYNHAAIGRKLVEVIERTKPVETTEG